ncbi:MAG: DUF3106 domain-containing protein [Burkholderiales bacterium]
MARRLLVTALTLLSLALASPVHASGKPAGNKPAPAAKAERKAPTWEQLTPQQKQLLSALEAQWNQETDRLRNSLVRVANKYPKMKPAEQERVRRRIARWASLTPEQRKAARERYKKIKKQPPEKQKEVKKKWEHYQSRKVPPAAPLPIPPTPNAPAQGAAPALAPPAKQ